MKVNKTELLEEIRKIVKKELLKEGTWALDKKALNPMLKDIEAFEKKWFKKVGDDIIADGVDNIKGQIKYLMNH